MIATRLGEVAILGGGCYGSFYLGQLLTAASRGGGKGGALDVGRILVIDRDPACQATATVDGTRSVLVTRDWGGFLDEWLDPARPRDPAASDMIVPTPMMPHLMALWLERVARRRWPDRDIALIPTEAPLGTPYDRLHQDGNRYVSFADWLCPIHCVEPLLCPAIRAPRSWEMREAIAAWDATRERAGTRTAPALFICRHVTFGVGMFSIRAASDALESLMRIGNSEAGGELAIGSISACHGAVAVLRIGAAPGAAVGVATNV